MQNEKSEYTVILRHSLFSPFPYHSISSTTFWILIWTTMEDRDLFVYCWDLLNMAEISLSHQLCQEKNCMSTLPCTLSYTLPLREVWLFFVENHVYFFKVFYFLVFWHVKPFFQWNFLLYQKKSNTSLFLPWKLNVINEGQTKCKHYSCDANNILFF